MVAKSVCLVLATNQLRSYADTRGIRSKPRQQRSLLAVYPRTGYPIIASPAFLQPYLVAVEDENEQG